MTSRPIRTPTAPGRPTGARLTTAATRAAEKAAHGKLGAFCEKAEVAYCASVTRDPQ